MKPKNQPNPTRRKAKAGASAPPFHQTPVPVSIGAKSVSLPSVDDLQDEAQQELDKHQIHRYLPVIRTLRQKSFTFREIAEWLHGRGVETDHNAVYRAFTKNLSDAEVAGVDDQEDFLQSEQR